MKKTNRKLLTAIITSVALFSLFACNDNDKNKNSTVSENKVSENTTSASQSESTSSVTSQSDMKNTTENNNALTSLSQTSVMSTSPSDTAVSESKGTEVTDKTSDVSTAKTTLAITESSTEKITDTTIITTTTTPPVTTVTEETTTEKITPNNVIFTWICANKDNTLPGDGQFAAVTFRIKENAAPGEYYVSMSSKKGNNNGAFAKYDGVKKYTDFDGGIISVSTGYIAADYDYQGNEIFVNLTNTHGNPGDTVTVFVDVFNNFPGVIGAASLKLEFDNSALEIISVEPGTMFDYIEKGTFASSLDYSESDIG